jgi:hypothetical protein
MAMAWRTRSVTGWSLADIGAAGSFMVKKCRVLGQPLGYGLC